MAFSGKATYSAGSNLPELAEDVSDIIGIVSPHETPLLDHLGDAKRAATSTVHEWIEDELLPNADAIDQASIASPTSVTSVGVDNGARFRSGDLVRPGDSGEVFLVTGVAGDFLSMTRGYGGTTPAALADNMVLTILGNAALEGAAADDARFTTRSRKQNYTQIFTKTIELSGSALAARHIGVDDELDYQKQERMRELLRDLENTVINGVAPAANQQGSTTVRRSMRGLLSIIDTNRFEPGAGPIPDGEGAGSDGLTEEVLNAAMKAIWDQSAGVVDTIVVGGAQKRRINAFVSSNRAYLPEDTAYRDLVSVYESDYGVARVVLSRWLPADTLMLLDSSRVEVMPLRGRSFQFKPLAADGDSTKGQVVGEYTLEARNENAHGVLTGLAV